MSTKNRFQIIKSVGSPSVSGAERVETLSDHTNNPEAHPDYMKKGAVPAVFSGGEHLLDKLGHAIYYARRAELCQTKSDYDQTKSISYVNNAENYKSGSGVKRHIVTTYVLSQILAGLGLDSTKSYVETSKIVKSTSIAPATNLDEYVVSYGLYKRVRDQVDYWLGDEGIENTYLKKVDAALTYVTQKVYDQHSHDFTKILGMPAALEYALTQDATYKNNTVYYSYDPTNTHTFTTMIEGVDYIIGNPIPENSVYVNIADKVYATEQTVTSLSNRTDRLDAISGYTRTIDTTYLNGITYYLYDATNKVMKKQIPGTDYTVGAVVPATTKLWVQVRNFDPTTVEPYDDAWLQAQVGYAKTTDTAWVSGVEYYAYNTELKQMQKVTDQVSTPVDRGLWCKISNAVSDARIGYVLTQDTARVTGVTYYKYTNGTMVVDTTTTDMSQLWVKAYNWRYSYNDAELKAKSGYTRSYDATPVTGVQYYKYDATTQTMVTYTPTSSPASEDCWIKYITASSTYDDRELKAKSGYARTADTTVINGTQYYQYSASPAPSMSTVTPPEGANPYDLGLYVLVKTSSGGQVAPYDDTAIKKELKKLGYVLTTDTSAVAGVTYYAVQTDGSMSAYATPPSNPFAVNAWVKAYNWRYSYNDTELKGKSGYALTADTAAVNGITYYYYYNGGMVAYTTPPTNPAQASAWCKIKNGTGSPGSSYDDTELRNRITNLESVTAMGFRPNWTEGQNLTITRTSKTNIWTIDAIPTQDGNSISGTIFISVDVNLDANTYLQVQVIDTCSTQWMAIQNCLSFHTYTHASNMYVDRVSLVTRCGSYDQFRIVVKTKSTDIDATYSTNYKLNELAPTKIWFVPDYQNG